MNSEDEEVRVQRVLMEDNIFNTGQQNYSANVLISENDADFSYSPNSPPRSNSLANFFDQYRSQYIIIASTTQIILGILGNSLTLVSDGVRVYVDYLEQFEFNRNSRSGKRLLEIILIGIATIGFFLLTIFFLLIASARAASMDFSINRLFLIVGTVMAMTTNTIQTMAHFRDWKANKGPDDSLYTNSKINQLLHGYGYHFVAYFVLVSALLIISNKSYLISDPVTTYVVCLLILSNIISIAYRLFHEYFMIENPYQGYESL